MVTDIVQSIAWLNWLLSRGGRMWVEYRVKLKTKSFMECNTLTKQIVYLQITSTNALQIMMTPLRASVSIII